VSDGGFSFNVTLPRYLPGGLSSIDIAYVPPTGSPMIPGTSRETVRIIGLSKLKVPETVLARPGNVTLIYKKIEDNEPPKILATKAFMIYKYLSLSVRVSDNYGVTSVLLKDQNGKTYYLKPKSDTDRYFNGLIESTKLDGVVIATDIGGNTARAEIKANGYVGIVLVTVVALVMIGLAILLISKTGERFFPLGFYA